MVPYALQIGGHTGSSKKPRQGGLSFTSRLRVSILLEKIRSTELWIN
jgi:hypothetical protein